MSAGLFFWEGKHAKTQARELEFYYDITAAKTISPLVQGYAALPAFDGYASQAEIDSFLGSTNEFLAANLTPGLDGFTVIVRMGSEGVGQAQTAVFAKATLATNTALDFDSESATGYAITNATPLTAGLLNEYEVGSAGNLAAKFVLNGLDAATSGIIRVQLKWISK